MLWGSADLHGTAEQSPWAQADMIADTLLVADGTSCRHQIHDGAGSAAVPVARVLGRALP